MKRKTAALACCLCALAGSALMASSASAATLGTTAVPYPELNGYSGSVSGSAGFFLLHSVISGVNVELQASFGSATGSAESMLAGTGEHTSNGTGTASFSGVSVVKPAGKGCAAYDDFAGGPFTKGFVEGETTRVTTAGQGMNVKFEPFAGSRLAAFWIEGCTGSKALEALNGKYEVTGSVKGEPSGTEVRFTAAGTTAQGTLKLRGQTAGINGYFEYKTGGGTALLPATFETP